ncbi:hypothetical protein FG386_000690 [Cryptosporidium ryanae]|uniref:uncharacterized protein n=1 Tax=Cryptosporidium ryanae TaxID=515981 RepID=UPI00351A0EDB|nr:hypothetical protein FG386_000690 [Cryptosporidium ryanae]
MDLGYKSESYERNFLQEKKECLENISGLFSGLNLSERDGDKLNEEQISKLTFLAREEIRRFLISRCIYEVVPENSKIMAMSSNIPLVIAICFLLEDKKKSMIVYDEMRDELTGTFTCNDVLLIFYVIHQLVSSEKKVLGSSGFDRGKCINEDKVIGKSNEKGHEACFGQDLAVDDLELPFSSLDEISNCTLRSWMTEVLNTVNYNKDLILNISDTLYDGVNACFELEDSRKVLNLGKKELQWRELGCWILKDQEAEDEHEDYTSDATEVLKEYPEERGIRSETKNAGGERCFEDYGNNGGCRSPNIKNDDCKAGNESSFVINEREDQVEGKEGDAPGVVNVALHKRDEEIIVSGKREEAEESESKEKSEKRVAVNNPIWRVEMPSEGESVGNGLRRGDTDLNGNGAKSDKAIKSGGVYPICYFSPLSVLVSLVQDLQICFGDLGRSRTRKTGNKKGRCRGEEPTRASESEGLSFCVASSDGFDEPRDHSCNIELKKSIIGRFFHKKVLGQLNLIPKGNKKCLKSSSSLASALELFLMEGQTHIPIVSDEDERYTGRVLTIDKCCTYFARCIAGQVKVRMEDSLEQVFPEAESKLQFLGGASLPSRVSDKPLNRAIGVQQILSLNSNCNKDCYEDRKKFVKGASLETDCDHEGEPDNVDFDQDAGRSNMSSSLVDMCLSGAITHILLSEEQCLVLVDKVTSKWESSKISHWPYIYAQVSIDTDTNECPFAFIMDRGNATGGSGNYEFEEVLPDYLQSDPEFATFYSVKLPSRLANDFLRLSSGDGFTSKYPHIKRMRRTQGPSPSCVGGEETMAVEMLIGEEPELPLALEEFLICHGIECVMSKRAIPRTPPYSRERYSELSKTWPLTYLRPKWSPEVLSDDVKCRANRFINLAAEIGRAFNGRGCVIELKGKVVSTGVGARDASYPWMHSFISAVNNFSDRLVGRELGNKSKRSKNATDRAAAGSARQEAEQESADDLVELGPGFRHVSRDDAISSSELKDQYLCTNCVVYFSHEPCISCSMALVHSRVSRVFYLNRDEEKGFLGSKHKLHCVPELNHHYRVFRVL